jgi:nucleotide-binding universal stress UspA family protein
MRREILCAVGGSDGSLRALRYAAHLATAMSMPLRIVHVVDMGWLPAGPEFAIDTAALCEARRAGGQEIVTATCEAARQAGVEAKSLHVETASPAQHVADAIAAEAARTATEIVVLGTHGRRGVRRRLVGSVAEQLPRICGTPVLLVHAQDATSRG